MFGLIGYFSLALAAVCCLNMYLHVKALGCFDGRKLPGAVCGLFAAALNAYFMREVFSTAWMVFLNVSLVLIAFDIFGCVLRIFGKKNRVFGKFVFLKKRAAAFLAAGVYVLYGLINIHAVRVTEYEIIHPDISEDITAALISDAHLGNAMDAGELAGVMEKALEKGADLIVLAGDIADESTPREEFDAFIDLLSDIRAPKGIYFVFGNHESLRSGGITPAEMERAYSQAGVTVLTDESILLDGWLRILGRKDGGAERARFEEIYIHNENEFTIVVDHRPSDISEVSGAGAELMLSGHTHNGQIFPVNLISVLLGVNEIEYGHERIGGTDFVVSSGVSGWRCAFRTAGKSEYVIIRLISE